MKKHFGPTLTATLAFGLMAAVAFGDSLFNDWSYSQNPNGVWSYNQGTTLLPYQANWHDDMYLFGTQPAWAFTTSGVGHVPTWIQVQSNPSNMDVQVGDILGHATSTYGSINTVEVANVTWTSPFEGAVAISGNAWMIRDIGRSVDWKLYLLDVLLSDGSLFSGDPYDRANPFDFADGSGGPGALIVAVTTGDTIRLNLAHTDDIADYAGLNLTITIVPEPSPVLLMGLVACLALTRLAQQRNSPRTVGRVADPAETD